MGKSGSGLLRLIIALALLGVAAVAVAAFVVIVALLKPEQVAYLADWSWSRAWLDYFAQLDGLPRLVAGASAIASGLISLVMLVRLPRGLFRPHASLHMLSADDHGVVVIDSKGIAAVATQAAMSTKGVIDAEVDVRGNGMSSVRLQARVGVHPGVNIKETGERARQVVHDAVEQLVGIGVANVGVSVRVLDPDDLARLMR